MMKRRLLSALLALATMLSSANVIAFAEGSDTAEPVSSQTESADGENGETPTPEEVGSTDDETVTEEGTDVQTADEPPEEPVLTAEVSPEPKVTETPASEEGTGKDGSTASISEPAEETEKPGDTGISEENPENNDGEAEGSGAVEDAVVLKGTFAAEQEIFAKKYTTAKSQKVATISFSTNDEWWPPDLTMGENCTLTLDDASGKFEIDTTDFPDRQEAEIYVKATSEAPTTLEAGEYPVVVKLSFTLSSASNHPGVHNADIDGVITVKNNTYVMKSDPTGWDEKAKVYVDEAAIELYAPEDGKTPVSIELVNDLFADDVTDLEYGTDYTFALAPGSKLSIENPTTENGNKYILKAKEAFTKPHTETVTVTPVTTSEHFGMYPLEITIFVWPSIDEEKPSFDPGMETVYYKVGSDKGADDSEISFTVKYGRGAYAINNAAVKAVKIGTTGLDKTTDYAIESSTNITLTADGLKKLTAAGSYPLSVTFGSADKEKTGETITFNDAIIVFTKLPELAVKDAFYSYTPGSDKNVEIKISNGKAGTKVLPIEVAPVRGIPLDEDDFTFDGETLTISSTWLRENVTAASVNLEITFKTSSDPLEVTINDGTDAPTVTADVGAYDFTKNDEGLHKDYTMTLANLGTQNGTAAVKSVTASFYASDEPDAVLIATVPDLVRVDHWSLGSDTGSGRTLTINKEWFASIAANAEIYNNLTNDSVMKFTIVAYAKDGSEATLVTDAIDITIPDADKKTFKAISGVEGLTLVDENEYNLLLTIKRADSIVRAPADLQEYFQTEDGKDLYTIAKGLTLKIPDHQADPETIRQWNTMLIPLDEQKTSVVYELDHPAYEKVTLNVRVADYTKEQEATAQKLGEDKAGAGVTTDVDTTSKKATVNINKRASSDAGEFDVNLLFTGIELPFGTEPEKLTTKVSHKANATTEQKTAVTISGTSKIVANKTISGVPLDVEFVSPNGYTYAKAEITVNTVVNEGTLSITPVLYEGQDKTTEEDQKKEADKYKAIYSAIGLNYSSNTFKYMDESFRLAALDDMDKVGDNYAAKIWFPVTLAEGQTFKYRIEDSLENAQKEGSMNEVKAPNAGSVNKAGFPYTVAIIDKNKNAIPSPAPKFVRYEVETVTDGTTVTTTSIQELKFSVVADTSVRKAYEPGAYELYKVAADKTYAEMGVTVSGTSIVYNKLVNKDAPKLNFILKAPTLNGVFPDAALMQSGEYLEPGSLPANAKYDKTIGGLVVNIPAESFNSITPPQYIRWGYKGEAGMTYKYTDASFKYNFTTIGKDAYVDATFGTKGKDATNIALADGSKTLPKDKLYAGDVTKGIEFTSTVSYVDALGKEATALTAEDRAKTEVTYSAEFVSSVKNENELYDSDDMVKVTFDANTNGKAPGTTVKADIDIKNVVSKGGTLTIYATFHNPKIMTDLTTSVSYKITPNQYVKEATPSATTAQVVLKNGKASYTPKVKINPSTKAYDKDHVWTVTGVSAANTPITSATINAATGKAEFTEAGTYTLKAEYKTKGLDGTTDKGLFGDEAATIKVQVYGEALKTFALKNSKKDKVIDMFIGLKDANGDLVADIPEMVATDAARAAVKAEDIKPDYIINYGKFDPTTNSEAAKIDINNETGKITVRKIDEGGTSATVTALFGGKTLSFKINAYATTSKDKVQLVLLEKGTSTVVLPKKVKAGVDYNYEFRKTSGDKAKLDIANSAVKIGPDGKKITWYDFNWNREENTIRMNAPVSGKINFTFKGDPAARKGAYSVSTNSKDNIVEPLTVSLSDPYPASYGAIFDNVDSWFGRVGTDGAILHFDDPNVTPSYANNQFTWTVSDSKYATIKANKEGGADLTWKKDSSADNKTITITAKSKGKSGISASYTLRTYDALANIGIASNPKTVLVNVADGAAGTLLPIVGLDNDETISHSAVATYNKKELDYEPVDTYKTEANGNIVTLRASSTAKAGKYYLAIYTSEGNGYFLPITTKLTKVTGDAVKVSGAKAGVVNTAVYGYKAPITLSAKNVDPLNVLLEMTDSAGSQDFALVRENGVWYAQYNSMEAKTGKVDLNLTWSVPGVGGGSGTVALKLTLKPTEKVNETFTVMKEKVNTFTGYMQPIELYFTGANAEYIKQNAIAGAAYLTDGKKSSFAPYMYILNDETGFYLNVKGDGEEKQANLAKLTKGAMTATLNVPLRGTNTVAEGVITLTVNTDAPKGIKAVITGSMPQIKAATQDEIDKALMNDGAVLTFTKPADWAYNDIQDIQLPEGFVKYPDGKPDIWRIGFTGSDYSAANKTIAMKLAFDKPWPADADVEQPKAVVDVTVSKPAASYTQQTHFEAKNLKLKRSDKANSFSVSTVWDEEDTFAYRPSEENAVKAGTTEYLEFADLKGMTLESSAPETLQVNSFTNKMYVKETPGTAVVTISKPGYVDAKLQVTVTEGGKITMIDPKDSSDTAYKQTGDYAYSYTYDRVTSTLEESVPLNTFTTEVGLTVSVADGQNGITFDGESFVIGNDTPADKAVRVTLKKPYAKDVTIDFTVKSGVVDAKDVTLSPEEGAWEVKDGVYNLTLTKGMKPTISAVIPGATEDDNKVFQFEQVIDESNYDNPERKVSVDANTDDETIYEFTLEDVPVEGAIYKFVGELENYKDIVVLVETPVAASMENLLAEGALKPYLSEDKKTLNLAFYGDGAVQNAVDLLLVDTTDVVIKDIAVSEDDPPYLTVEKDTNVENQFTFTTMQKTPDSGTLPTIKLTSDYYEDLELNVKIAGPADMKPKTNPAGMTWEDTEKVYKVEELKAGEPLSITFNVNDGTVITPDGASYVTVTKGEDGKTFTLKVATVAEPANETIIFSANGYEDVKVTVSKTVAGTLADDDVSITGTPKVGEKLTAHVEPEDAETGAIYKWERSKAEGGYDTIADPSTKEYTLTTDDVGKKIKVTVTAGGSLFAGTASDETAIVAKGDLKKVEIAGTAAVDSTLNVTFEPSDATVDYQWLMSDSADGTFTPIPSATASSLALTGTHLGKYIKVKVTAKNSDTAYTGSITSDATSKVTQKVTAVTITGGDSPKVGVALTATVTPIGADVDYEWQICDTENGTYTAIPGATSATYTPSAEQVYMYIKVKVTGTGNYTESVTSNATAVVAAAV